MKSRITLVVGSLLLILTLLAPSASRPVAAQTTYTHDIIIYGAGFGGISAAINAHRTYKDLNAGANPRILLINPQSELGGLGGLNGQNFWDWRPWPAEYVNGLPQKVGVKTLPNSAVSVPVTLQPQMGNHAKFIAGNGIQTSPGVWIPQFDQFYATGEMSVWLNQQLTARSAITLLQPQDVKTVTRDATGRITSIGVQKLKRENQAWLFDTTSAVTNYTAPIFIDASETARLSRLANLTYSLGREDRNTDRRQMVATLMFKVKGLDTNTIKNLAAQGFSTTGWGYLTDSNGHIGIWGGGKEISNAVGAASGTPLYPLGQFNKNNDRYQIKAMNVAEDRYSTTAPPATLGERVYWVNTLLVVGVDGNCERKDGCADQGTTAYPGDGLLPWSTDYAFAQARLMLNTPSFLNAMRAFPGFGGMQLITQTVNGIVYPTVGESMYLRETIHLPSTIGARIDETNFAMTGAEIIDAGGKTTAGTDESHYANRIGLGYYQMDSNGYTKSNPLSGNVDADPIYGREPVNPSYVPVETILTAQVPNLITPGYSASIGSKGWTMMRVLPNLTVLGDAAGVLAGYARTYQADPLSFASNSTWMTNVRNRIKLYDGRVDKCFPVTTTCTR